MRRREISICLASLRFWKRDPRHPENPRIDPLIRDPAHFVGIGGSGVSALAEYLTDRGLTITGCDSHPTQRIKALRALGIQVWIGHDPRKHLHDIKTVVHTAAVSRDHSELAAARGKGIQVLPRSLLMARISRSRDAICVAGSHGKSSVAALTAHILTTAGLDPGYILGAVSSSSQRGGYFGSGHYSVIETDEFDRTLERVCPAIAVITNVEAEHLDVYRSFKRLRAAFLRFARRGSDRLGTIMWEDVPQELSGVSGKSFIRCGTSRDCGCRGEIRQTNPLSMEVAVTLFGTHSFEAILPMTGTHSLANAILASAASFMAGVDTTNIAAGLSSYPGLQRRFEQLGNTGDTLFITDYAHHPTEVAAALGAARVLGKPVIAVFQPHLYTRTAQLHVDFSHALSAADQTLVTAIYPAREPPIPGITGSLIVEGIRAKMGKSDYCHTFEEVGELLRPKIGDPLTIIFLSAGDLDAWARDFVNLG